MKKILSIEQAIKLSRQLKREGKTIVLVGGCFDILHIGHVAFLEAASKEGDVLFVLLENDAAVKQNKGIDRPINRQKDRAKILSSLRFVDYVVLIPNNFSDQDYDNLVIGLKPAIIATTKGDPERKHKERQATMLSAKVVDVIEQVIDSSSSRLAKILSKHFSL